MQNLFSINTVIILIFQTAIVFIAPKYITQELDKPVEVRIQLVRPLDGDSSDPLPFQYIPSELGKDRLCIHSLWKHFPMKKTPIPERNYNNSTFY